MKLFTFQKNYLINFIAAALIFLFVYTALNKLANIESFKLVMQKSPILKDGAGLLSWFIPIGELLISIFLFLPNLRSYGFVLSSLLIVAFTLYIGYMLLFIPELPCSCGGIIQEMNWSQHLLFNLIFLMFSIFGWRTTRTRNKDFIAINRQSRIPV